LKALRSNPVKLRPQGTDVSQRHSDDRKMIRFYFSALHFSVMAFMLLFKQ